jgi:hypothetical protein
LCQNLTKGDFWDGAIFPVSLANQEKSLNGTQLKGMMTAANYNHLATQLRKRLWQTTRTMVLNTNADAGVFLDFQLPFGTKPAVCRHFFQLLFCLKPDAKWKSLRDSLKKTGPGPRKHGLTGNNNNPGIFPCKPDLDDFLSYGDRPTWQRMERATHVERSCSFDLLIVAL